MEEFLLAVFREQIRSLPVWPHLSRRPMVDRRRRHMYVEFLRPENGPYQVYTWHAFVEGLAQTNPTWGLESNIWLLPPD